VYPVVEHPGIGMSLYSFNMIVFYVRLHLFSGTKKPSTLTTPSLLAAPLKSGFDSHYVVTAIDGYPALNEGLNFYDEFVIVQEHQILPAFILRFNESDISDLFLEYHNELYLMKMKEIDQYCPVESAPVARPRFQTVGYVISFPSFLSFFFVLFWFFVFVFVSLPNDY
jgi:hypothetical protein